MFCAKTATCEPRALSIIGVSAVNGGQIATSTPSRLDTRGSSPWINCSASATVLFIFQFPAISGVRLTAFPSAERDDAGQLAPLDQLERRAAAGREVRHAVCEAELRERRGRVAAADDRRAGACCNRLGDRACAA